MPAEAGEADRPLNRPTVPAGFEIVRVRADDPLRIAAVARLFTAYTDALGIDLAYQDYAAELAGLPGKYGPPGGALLLLVRNCRNAEEADAGAAEAAVGCVALRPLPDVGEGGSGGDDDKVGGGGSLGKKEGANCSSGSTGRRRTRRRAEIKRLYVDPAARGHRLGRALFAAVLAEARSQGYDEVVLDTLAHMTEARRMYEREGFVRLDEPYYEVAGGGDVNDDVVGGTKQQQHPESTVFYQLNL